MEDSTIILNNTGKRFNFDWIFRNIQFSFNSSQHHAITGPNGSGKSTLLQMIAGCISPSSGQIEVKINQQVIESADVFQHLSFTAPYIDLPEELTCREIISFQQKFKPFLDGLSCEAVVECSGLGFNKNKTVRYFSSGMKQRLKLSLAILSNAPIVLLDEPTVNLDETSAQWYLDLVQKYSFNRLFIIASNLERDYHFCKTRLRLVDYKED